MTAAQKRQWSLGAVVSVVAILTAVAGWHARAFATGREDGELRQDVKTNTRDIKRLDERLDSEIKTIRVEIREGFNRMADKIDQAAWRAPR